MGGTNWGADNTPQMVVETRFRAETLLITPNGGRSARRL